MRRTFFFIYFVFVAIGIMAQQGVETQRKYLSGHGCNDMVDWDFYCTGGQNANKWTKIGVPSCWELQGFGTYQYGMRFYGKPNPEGIADEKGKYKYDFYLPQSWENKQIELVFEAVMTDAKVTINGRKAGSGLHQGGFYRFSFDVSDRIYFGKHKNHLEVEVSKESSNTQVNMAERRADYWNFGGIFRPVFVVAKPVRNIDRVAINAKMDGTFLADCFLSRAMDGAKVNVQLVPLSNEKGNAKKIINLGDVAVKGDMAKVNLKIDRPTLWTAETPNRYDAIFTLLDKNGKTLHIEHQKFGFRTIEYRKSDGVYINGTKVIFKGVNRHSFRPESGRTLSPDLCIEDVKLIKSMNMNAVRLSHYPADPEFLDACDSLGLYVENELSGWHWAHETVVGQKLVKEMVTRDVNHPCVIFWSNGNEGGFNEELEPEFSRWDIQKRVVLYPWANKNGFETKHYRSWGETQEYMRKPEIFMPTEFLHGLYDGGHGAGLKDYWDMMMKNPRCAGGFLWDLADEGVVRTDKDNIVDCMGNFGSDGIVGPHFEKEGSYYTIKEVWSPVEIIDSIANSHLVIRNHYDFRRLDKCKFVGQYLLMPELGQSKENVIKEFEFTTDAAPHKENTVLIPSESKADALRIKVVDELGNEIITKVFNINKGLQKSNSFQKNTKRDCYVTNQSDNTLKVEGCGRVYRFDKSTGYLSGCSVKGHEISFKDGPRFLASRRSDRSLDQFYNHDDKDAEKKKTQYSTYEDQGKFIGFKISSKEEGLQVKATYANGCLDSVIWTFLDNACVKVNYSYNFGGVVDEMGVMFSYPEEKVEKKSWVGNGPYRVWQNRLQGPQYGYWSNAYNDPIPGESWDYPEFKGYFADVNWMQIETKEGKIDIWNTNNKKYIGVYQPRDGRDKLLYDLPESGISILDVIPAVRNKVNTTDLNGPSAQPFWAKNNEFNGEIFLKFE